jgi:DNA end-binding protein Ku
VIVDEKEIENLKPEKGRTIEIEQFVDMAEVDAIYFNRAYYVAPAEGAAKPYRLLVEAMKHSGKAAVARFTFHERQHLVVLRVIGEVGIALHTLHYADEVIPIDDVLPERIAKAKVTKQELDVAERLIEALSRPLDVSEWRDRYREKLQQLIDAKAEGKTVRVSDTQDDEPPPRTINLMEALKKSLAQNRAAVSRGGANGNGRSHHAPRRKSA